MNHESDFSQDPLRGDADNGTYPPTPQNPWLPDSQPQRHHHRHRGSHSPSDPVVLPDTLNVRLVLDGYRSPPLTITPPPHSLPRHRHGNISSPHAHSAAATAAETTATMTPKDQDRRKSLRRSRSRSELKDFGDLQNLARRHVSITESQGVVGTRMSYPAYGRDGMI